MIDFLRVQSRSFMFTAAAVPAAIGATLGALELIRSDEGRELMAKVLDNARYLHRGLAELGYQVNEPLSLPDGIELITPIVPILVGDDWRAVMLWRALWDAGVYVNVAIYPAVQRGGALLRTSVMATHEREHLDRALEAFERVQKDVPEPPGRAPRPIGRPRAASAAPELVRQPRGAASAPEAPACARSVGCAAALEPAELVGAGAGHQVVEGGFMPSPPRGSPARAARARWHAVVAPGPLLRRPGTHELHDVGGQVERVRHDPAVRAAHGHTQLAVHEREQRVAARGPRRRRAARDRGWQVKSASVELRMVIAPVISYLLVASALCNRHIHLIGNAITGYHG